MKKILFVLLMLMCMAHGFSLDLSVGGGLNYAHSWSSFKARYYGNAASVSAKANAIGVKGFFDAQYALLELGAMFAVGDSEVNASSFIGGIYKSESLHLPLRATDIHLGLFGKYPFTLGIVKIYPIAGFEFNFNIYANLHGEDLRARMTEEAKKDSNSYYFSFGLGSDIYASKQFFIRPVFLFGIQMNKNSEYKKLKELAPQGLGLSYKSFKVDLGISVGYKF